MTDSRTRPIASARPGETPRSDNSTTCPRGQGGGFSDRRESLRNDASAS